MIAIADRPIHFGFSSFFDVLCVTVDFNRFSLPINRNLEIARCSDDSHRLLAATVEPIFFATFFQLH